MSVAERFWRMVPHRPEVGCWEWAGSTKGNGYGQFRVAGKTKFAHRISYELAHGPVTAGLVVRHKCDNRICVRPDHLETGTQRDNLLDMRSRGRERHFTPSGERNHAAKLSDGVVSIIRDDQTNSLSALAARYGVTPQRISQIQRRRHRAAANERGELVEVQP